MLLVSVAFTSFSVFYIYSHIFVKFVLADLLTVIPRVKLTVTFVKSLKLGPLLGRATAAGFS